MGGNVFPGLNRRYDRDEYLKIESYLAESTFLQLFSRFDICSYLPDKQTFGDMDVICIPKSPLSIDRLKDCFNTEHVSHNGDTWSLLFEKLQIDLIITNELEYEFHKNYLGAYDRCNFVGKIAHQFGLKFGHDGLWLPVRTSDSHLVGNILLTLDYKKAEEFLDIKPLNDAKTFDDVFKNITASKYFNPNSFAFENITSIGRIRDRKRPSYHQFLELCQQLPAHGDYYVKSENKLDNLTHIFDAFPEAKMEYDRLYEIKRRQDCIKEKFNGKLVKEWTGKTDKELGLLMIALKSSIGDVYYMNPQEIKDYVINFEV